MLTPSLFNGSFELFDDLYQDPWFGFDDREFKNLEKKLYGHRAKNVMNTDIKESDKEYELEMDLPGFKKDEVSVELNDGYLTISAAKGLNKDEAESKAEAKKGNYIRRERYSGACQRSFYVGEEVTTKIEVGTELFIYAGSGKEFTSPEDNKKYRVISVADIVVIF